MGNLNRRRAVLVKLQWTRIRQKAWREKRPTMEAALAEAQKQAKENKKAKDDALRTMIAGWPKTISPKELKDLVQRDIEYTKRYSSLVYRFTRKRMLEFKPDGLWHNLCSLLPDSTSLPDSIDTE